MKALLPCLRSYIGKGAYGSNRRCLKSGHRVAFRTWLLNIALFGSHSTRGIAMLKCSLQHIWKQVCFQIKFLENALCCSVASAFAPQLVYCICDNCNGVTTVSGKKMIFFGFSPRLLRLLIELRTSVPVFSCHWNCLRKVRITQMSSDMHCCSSKYVFAPKRKLLHWNSDAFHDIISVCILRIWCHGTQLPAPGYAAFCNYELPLRQTMKKPNLRKF